MPPITTSPWECRAGRSVSTVFTHRGKLGYASFLSPASSTCVSFFSFAICWRPEKIGKKMLEIAQRSRVKPQQEMNERSIMTTWKICVWKKELLWALSQRSWWCKTFHFLCDNIHYGVHQSRWKEVVVQLSPCRITEEIRVELFNWLFSNSILLNAISFLNRSCKN